MHRRTPRRHFWIAIVGSVSLGCGPDARAVFDQMHQAACSGDADKFFVHVDEERLFANEVKRSEGTPAPDALLQTDPRAAEFLMRAGARAALEAWRQDIGERGKDGDVCGWAFVAAERIGDNERVEVRSKAGNKKFLYFGKSDGKLRLVRFRGVPDRTGPAVDHSGSGTAEATITVSGSLRPSTVDVARQPEFEADKQQVEQQLTRLKKEIEQTRDPEKIAALQAQVAAAEKTIEMIRAATGSGVRSYPGGMTYEAALNANKGQDKEDAAGVPDLTDDQLAAPLRHASFIVSCGAPDSTKVTVRVAVRKGRAIGVTVTTKPPNAASAACIDRAVRELRWTESAKTDFVTTNY